MKIKKSIPLAFAAGACVLLSACGESVKSAEYYFAHQDEMWAMNAKCGNDVQKILTDKNCINSTAAIAMRYR